ncbi:hypothetical protein LCGC14_0589600 [marine sediment metagenome]|uniref:Uncharacterized protein n=1 Tax=marine sediment metagenome TaxID=412755 RepID=A0A0F9U004_9ZZZZ
MFELTPMPASEFPRDFDLTPCMVEKTSNESTTQAMIDAGIIPLGIVQLGLQAKHKKGFSENG